MGRGIGWVDVQLLASARLTGIPLWTLDRRLKEVAMPIQSPDFEPGPARGRRYALARFSSSMAEGSSSRSSDFMSSFN